MATTATPDETPAAKAGPRKKRILIFGLALVIIAGGAYWFLRPQPPKKPEKGEVSVLEPVQINLSEGHYLRLAIALQLSADVKEEVDGSEALAAAVDMLSGLPVAEFAKPEGRRKLFHELTADVLEKYEGEVLDLYVTEAVTQ